MSQCLQHSGKRVSVFGGDAVQELKGAGGVDRMTDFIASLGGVLDALGVHFSSFLLLSFFISIFRRFFDFGKVLGGFVRPKWLENRDFGCFGGFAFRVLNFG